MSLEFFLKSHFFYWFHLKNCTGSYICTVYCFSLLMQKHDYMFIFDLWNPYVNSFLKKEILQKLFFHVKLKWLKQNVIFGYLYIFSCVQTETWFPVFKQRHGFLCSNRDMVSCVQTEIWFPNFLFSQKKFLFKVVFDSLKNFDQIWTVSIFYWKQS